MESFDSLIDIFLKYRFFDRIKQLKNNRHEILLNCSEHLFVADINLWLRDIINFLNNVEVIIEDKLVVGLLWVYLVNRVMIRLCNLLSKKSKIRLFLINRQLCDNLNLLIVLLFFLKHAVNYILKLRSKFNFFFNPNVMNYTAGLLLFPSYNFFLSTWTRSNRRWISSSVYWGSLNFIKFIGFRLYLTYIIFDSQIHFS